MTPTSEFGTPEYYKNLFDDILCDAGEDINRAHNILSGFRMSMEDWFHYHCKTAQTYSQMLTSFINDKVNV